MSAFCALALETCFFCVFFFFSFFFLFFSVVSPYKTSHITCKSKQIKLKLLHYTAKTPSSNSALLHYMIFFSLFYCSSKNGFVDVPPFLLYTNRLSKENILK